MVPVQGSLPPQQAPSDSGDLWGDLGFDPPPAAPTSVAPPAEASVQEEKKEGDLPPGGEFYDARIFTPTLGVMFFKPQELTDSLFLNTDRAIVDALNERPVVAFIVEGSSARSAGVELGHVLLKVNGVDVKNPKEASRLIKEGPRPLPLLFYVPNTDVVVAEGEHMVKYDTRETTAPNTAKDWKPKYVVIGGIIAQPWMMNMYRSKSEYDIAVIETQARRPVSVKVKQFSLQGARIQNDWQGPQMVKYKNKLHPWKYIVVLPVARNPIKISSPNLAQLKPVHEGIRRVLLAAQRSRGGNSHTAAPVSNRDPYSQQQYSRPPPQQGPPTSHQQQYPQNAGYAQPSGYTGGY
jgi:PDZ domain